MRLTMMKHALALGIAFTIVTPPAAAWAGFEPANRLAAPFPSNATIYRPDCWIKEDPSNHCDVGGGRIRD
jgi:hypothetical protein